MNDPIWETIRNDVANQAKREPSLADFYYKVVLSHATLEEALIFLLSSKLESTIIAFTSLYKLIDEAYKKNSTICEMMREDIEYAFSQDMTGCHIHNILLYCKGFHSLQVYRIAHYFWNQNRKSVASCLQDRVSEVFGVDIHPAAYIGKGITMNHATSIVIGETAVVEDYVTIMHEVTLGSTGKESGDRHPKVRLGVHIGAGAKLLGNIEIGENAKIGSGSVVLEDVPPNTTVVGVPARVI